MITTALFLDFLHCKRKAFLKSVGTTGEQTNFERVDLELDRIYKAQARETFLQGYELCEVISDPPSLQVAMKDRPQFIVNLIVETEDMRSEIQLLEQIVESRKRRVPLYSPVLFVKENKIRRVDKLLLAFQGLALASVQNVVPPVGRIVHGRHYRTSRVKLQPLVREVRSLLSQIRDLTSAKDAPILTLNRHCSVCPFQSACQKLAEETDNLSLMRGMSEKEIEKQRSRGISTVTQFSRKHNHALQALAYRDKKIYVLDTPTIQKSEVALYLDVEGVPDRDLYYLIGLLAVQDGQSTMLSFWADDEEQQKAMWDACAKAIEKYPNYTVYHYGSYEARFLDRMRGLATRKKWTWWTTSAHGLATCSLPSIRTFISQPPRTGLKDIGRLLGASWSVEGACGIQTLTWRAAWELGKEEATKQRLLQYNQEDCLALQRVTEFILALCDETTVPVRPGQLPVTPVRELESPSFRFGKTEFFCQELAWINKCAYSDYQRERVYVRTSPAIRKSLRRKERASKVLPKASEHVDCGRLERCPACGSEQVHVFRKLRSYKSMFDLKFTRSGVKRWIVRYGSLRYRCWACRKTFNADDYRAVNRFGPQLSSWLVYHHIALGQSYDDLNTSLNDIFGFSFSYSILKHVKPRMATLHRATYERMKEKLRRGPLVHADETKVKLKGKAGYVWAFTNMEEVVYAYTSTREGTILDEVLNDFQGVLVSDFYSAYDSPKCPQQKCLIHLIRDINDDLFHNLFDEELKQLAQRFVALLKPIIETIDRFGLKRHFLGKHRPEAERFFRDLFTEEFRSELARKYQKRIRKYKDKLFVFLDHDGIPWNNNNAENAIKRFASRRKIMGTSFTEKSIQDHLVLFSIYQTCRLKNLSFLQFLRSGILDIDVFAENRFR